MPARTVINPKTGRRIKVGGPTYRALQHKPRARKTTNAKRKKDPWRKVPAAFREDPSYIRDRRTGRKHKKGTVGYQRRIGANRRGRQHIRYGGLHKKDKSGIAWAKKHAELMGYDWV